MAQKTPYFEQYFHGLKKILDTPYQYLVDLNFDILVYTLDALDINTKIVKASNYSFGGSKSELVLDMCIQLNADTYIFGEQGKNYADANSFNNKGISLYFQSYNHPVYNQPKGEFLPYMSILDLLFNEGEKSRDILLLDNATKQNVFE